MKARGKLFAVPFVLVVGCGPKPVAAPHDLPAPPEGTPTRTSEGGATVFVYPEGHKVYVGADGSCTAQYREDCGAGESSKPVVVNCNPPPPQKVKCPVEK